MAVALAGLDAGTAFGGMGASRAMTIGALAEPALLVAFLALSIQAGTSNLPGIISATLAHPQWAATPERLLALSRWSSSCSPRPAGSRSTTRPPILS